VSCHACLLPKSLSLLQMLSQVLGRFVKLALHQVNIKVNIKFWCYRVTKLKLQLHQEGLWRDGADPELVPRDELVNRRLQHLEHVIEGQVAHMCAIRESVQRTAGDAAMMQCTAVLRFSPCQHYSCLSCRYVRVRHIRLSPIQAMAPVCSMHWANL
jgi:hypothetical protein